MSVFSIDAENFGHASQELEKQQRCTEDQRRVDQNLMNELGIKIEKQGEALKQRSQMFENQEKTWETQRAALTKALENLAKMPESVRDGSDVTKVNAFLSLRISLP